MLVLGEADRARDRHGFAVERQSIGIEPLSEEGAVAPEEDLPGGRVEWRGVRGYQAGALAAREIERVDPALIVSRAALRGLRQEEDLLAPGRNTGKRWLFCDASRLVSVFGVPPLAGTIDRPVRNEGVKTMFPSGPQAPPRGVGASQSS